MRTAVRIFVATIAAAAIGIACAIVPSPAAAPTANAATGYKDSPRCDGVRGARAPVPKRVALVGNSVAAELRACLGTILSQRGHTMQNINNPGASFCDLYDNAQDAPKADLAVLYGVRVRVTACTRGDDSPEAWARQAEVLTNIYLRKGSQVLLIPPPRRMGEVGEDPAAPLFRKIAAKHPSKVVVGDVGKFLRISGARWIGSASCEHTASGALEAGCKSGSVAVRDPRDRMHMCADPKRNYPGYQCPTWWGAGQRRASSSVAVGILPRLT